MSQAQTILQQFLNKEIECFDFQKSLFEYYKTTDRTEDIQQEILDIIKSLDNDETVRKDMWSVFFYPDRQMHRQIDLLQVKLMAQNALDDNLREPHPILLKTSAMLAWSNCRRDSDRILDQEKAEIWFDTFKNFSDFKPFFEKEVKRSDDVLLDAKNKYPDYFQEIENKKNKPIIESYEIIVPVKASVDDSSVWNAKEMDILVQEIIVSFNELGLQGYMKSFEQKCYHSKIEFNDKSFIFTFDCHKKLNDLNKAKDDFRGQLSDGWGSGASQIELLIGKEEVSLEWEIEKMSDFVAKQSKNKNKPK